MPNRPVYPRKPIRSVGSLCRALGLPEGLLRSLGERIPQLYIGPIPKLKKDGKSIRYVYDTKFPLKSTLKTINRVIFEKVQFPVFLQGSLKGRDYVSNVDIHAGSQAVITEDIKGFFDHITADRVNRMWRDFFGFHAEPAALLTALTTRDGRVFQGTPTSSYLANLAFWDIESTLVEKMTARGLRYSRYVDDITISSTSTISDEDKSWAIGQVIAMMGSRGFSPAREKHRVQSAHERISVMGLNVSRAPGLPAGERSGLRAAVYQLESRLNLGERGPELGSELSRVGGRIGRMKRFHPREATQLQLRVRAVADALNSLPFKTRSILTPPLAANNSRDTALDDAPPF